jgi:hypothetical protein
LPPFSFYKQVDIGACVGFLTIFFSVMCKIMEEPITLQALSGYKFSPLRPKLIGNYSVFKMAENMSLFRFIYDVLPGIGSNDMLFLAVSSPFDTPFLHGKSYFEVHEWYYVDMAKINEEDEKILGMPLELFLLMLEGAHIDLEDEASRYVKLRLVSPQNRGYSYPFFSSLFNGRVQGFQTHVTTEPLLVNEILDDIGPRGPAAELGF